MMDRDQLELAIAAQEQLRGLVDNDVIDLAVDALRRHLGPLDRNDQRRRHVTVLFADLQGFTSLAESLDAELVAELVNDVWSRLDDVVTANGGRIDKHIGDAVMAVWGAESSREDDPERAVRAAIGLHVALAAHTTATGQRLALRVGVSTGAVLLGTVGTTNEFTAMGDTVNVAARLEQAAAAGEVLISHDTYRHVRGVFDVRPQELLQVKGKVQPLQVYVVQAEKPRAFRIASRGVEGIETRMIGRADELAQLLAAFARVCAGGSEAFSIVGEPGVGKSRLVAELLAWVERLDTPVYFLQGRALATDRTVPHGVLRDVLATRFGIGDSDDTVAVEAKLTAGFAPHLHPDAAVLVGLWLGFELAATAVAQRMRGSMGLAAAGASHLFHFLREVSRLDPILLVVEDLHWADEESLLVLSELAVRLHRDHILAITTARPGVVATGPARLATSPEATVLRLDPLGPESNRALVVEVLQRVEEIPAALMELIVGRTDGNPFFVEELVKMLLEDGVIRDDDVTGKWRLDLDRLDPSAVPSTLTGVLEARLDSLDPKERAALQRASVVVRVFWDSAVSALKPGAPMADTATSLRAVQDRELVYPLGALDARRRD